MTNLTKKALADALVHFLEKKTLDSITIKELTDYCGLNRQTFYYHFRDVYDLTNWILFEAIENVTQASRKESIPIRQTIKAIGETLSDNKELITNLYHSSHINPLLVHIRKLNYLWIKAELASFAFDQKIAQEDFDFLVDFYSAAVSGFLIRWINSDMEYDTNTLIDQLFWVLDNTHKLSPR